MGWGALIALVAALLFLATGGLFGGMSMLLDPSGASLGMDAVLPHMIGPLCGR